MIFKNHLLILGIILNTLPFLNGHTTFKLNTIFFFDPETKTPCNETNYWTPFDKSKTCYRFVSITIADKDTNAKIKLMLDHNIGVGKYENYKSILKEKTSKWTRYSGEVDIIDEATIYKLMKYSEKPSIKKPSNPPTKIAHYCSNSRYTVNGKVTNEKGYWTKTISNINLAYAVDSDGKNMVSSTSEILGIRPVINVEKSLLVEESKVIDITSILKNAKTIKYNHETKKYDGHVYKQLQGFTVSNDKLIFMSSNKNNYDKSVMYSYKLSEIDTLFKEKYGMTGHGNGMTYNSKKDEVLVVGPYNYTKIYLYNGKTLEKKKEVSSVNKPTSIGYDSNNDLYIQHRGKRIFMTDTEKFEKLQDFDINVFETTQDLEYHNGFTFLCSTEGGPKSKYQSYSFFKSGANLIYVYNTKLNKEKNATKGFGRLITRLYMTGLGELESVSFRGGYMYFGFAPHLDGKPSYVFYKVEYKQLAKAIKKLS